MWWVWVLVVLAIFLLLMWVLTRRMSGRPDTREVKEHRRKQSGPGLPGTGG
jgi:hypothetical protein